jgi:Family of unknown function (DUF6535)
MCVSRPETTVQDVPHAMQGSDPSPRAEKDVASGFWSTYERVAKQHDDEFIERQNGDLDSLLIFVCLSAISFFQLHSTKRSFDTLGWSFLLSQLRFYRQHGA